MAMVKCLLFLILLLGVPELRADDSDTTNEVIGIVSDCLDIGSYALDALEPLGAIAKVGSIVLGMVDHKDDPVMQKLNDLDRKLDLLGREMNQKFDELEAFMVEVIFYTQMAETASMLHKFMQDTISTPCNESFNIFYLEYTRNPPMEYTYRLLSMLEEPTTNPLMMAMNADKLHSNATFQKWRTIIDGVTAEFLFIETYANGLFSNQSMYEPNTMKGRLVTLQGQMNGWKQMYMNTYWPNIVQQLMYDTQDQNVHATNAQRAQIIKNSLAQVLTDDAFFIMSYNPCSGYGEHSFDGINYLMAWRRDNSNLVVFRSQHWKNATDAEQKAFIQSANRFNSNLYEMKCEKEYKDEPGDLLNSIPNSGLIGMVHTDNDMTVEYVNNAHRGPDMPGLYFAMMGNCKHHPVFGTVAGYI